MNRIAREVAQADQLLKTELGPVGVVRPTHANVLVDVAKRLQRLQTKAQKLRRELKATESDIKLARKELRALAADMGRGKV